MYGRSANTNTDFPRNLEFPTHLGAIESRLKLEGAQLNLHLCLKGDGKVAFGLREAFKNPSYGKIPLRGRGGTPLFR